jgi:hypothetical protein
MYFILYVLYNKTDRNNILKMYTGFIKTHT